MLLTIEQDNNVKRQIQFTEGCSLLEILISEKMRMRSTCSGKGLCGLCLVRIISGQVNELDEREREVLSEELIAQGIRLACIAKPYSDVSIDISAVVPRSLWKPLDEKTLSAFSFHLSNLSAITPGKFANPRYATAIDIGTTHIRILIWNKTTGVPISGCFGYNPQAIYGSDILTRLMLASDSRDSAKELIQLTLDCLAEALWYACSIKSIKMEFIEEMTIVGNTAMVALLSENNFQFLLDPESWDTELNWKPADTREWVSSWGIAAYASIFIVPPLAGFVGSDLLADIVSTRLYEREPGALLIDFGTNTEIALWDGKLICVTSVAGGPAFEGNAISNGMSAVKGAISHVTMIQPTGNSFQCEVIGGGKARGICATGLIDTLACLLDSGLLGKNGNFLGTAAGMSNIMVHPDSDITINKYDIDLLQRAKSPVAAAIYDLTAKAGMKLQDIREICVTGTFGHMLNVENAQKIGLLPPIEHGKIELGDNRALEGCSMLMLDPDRLKTIEYLKSIIKVFNMALSENFGEMFLQNLYLQPMDMKL